MEPSATLEITAELAGRTLADVVRRMQPGTPWSKARELCKRGKVLRNGTLALDAAERVHAGDRVELALHAPRRHEHVLGDDALVYLDNDVVVVNKPADLLSVPFEDGDKNTLVDRARARVRRKAGMQGAELGVVQRLDKDTTGVIVFTRTLAAKRVLQQQFRAHSIERRYLAIVHGKLAQALDCDTLLVRDRGDGLRGSFGRFRRAQGKPPRDAQRAITHVRPLAALQGATLVECELETGRQHQIRIHVAENGHPLVGERVYVRDYEGDVIDAPRPMLHATLLGFAHPRTGRRLRFEREAPDDFQHMLERLGFEKRN